MDKTKNAPELRPEMLKSIYEVDRTEWTYDMYISAGLELSNIKGFSQWVTGMLAEEVCGKKLGDHKAFAQEIHLEPGTVSQYRRVYRELSKLDYTPDGFFPFGVLQIAVNYTSAPLETLEDLKGKGIQTAKAAVREIKKEQGKVVAKRPKIKLGWDSEKELWTLEIPSEDLPKIDWSRVQVAIKEYWESM